MTDADILKLIEKIKRSTTNLDILTVMQWAEKIISSNCVKREEVLTQAPVNKAVNTPVNKTKASRAEYLRDYMRKKRAAKKAIQK